MTPDGGAQVQARRQALELVGRGHRVMLVTWQMGDQVPAPLPGVEIVGVRPLHVGGQPRMGNAAYLLAGARLFRELVRRRHEYDVLHLHQLLSESIICSFVGAVLRKPVVVKVACEARWPTGDLDALQRNRTNFPAASRFVPWLARTVVAVAMTDQIEQELRAAGFKHIRRIPNGVEPWDTEALAAARTTVRAELGAGESDLLVGCMGRLTPQKGMDTLLRAWRVVERDVPSAKLHIVGRGPDKGALARITREAALERVAFHEAGLDGRRFLTAMDIVAVPSRGEGMSNVLLEAMAAGRPVVATDVSGTRDLLRDGANGIIVPIDNQTALAGALVRLLTNRSEALRFGAAAKRTVEEGFTVSSVVDRYSALYCDLLR